MKKSIVILLSLLIFFSAYSQNEKPEKKIRQIEQKRTAAYMIKDTVTLLKMYAPGYSVNSPGSRVIGLNEFIKRLMSGVTSGTGCTNTIKKIIIKGNIVISMGNESHVGAGNNPEASQTITMRYTNFGNERKRWQEIICKAC